MKYKGKYYDLLTDKSKKEADKEFNEWLKDASMIFFWGLILGFVICTLIK